MSSIPLPTSANSSAPELLGIHHVGLTVRDHEASEAWYQKVLRLVRLFEEPHHGSHEGGSAVVVGPPDLRFSIGLDCHPAHAGDTFDPTRTGLDHLSLLVASDDDLESWAAHLSAEAIEHSGVYRVDGIPATFLTFHDPDGIQLELIALHLA
jgi:catechol 2,3-dioxygenase-like lactoylglutathione lyase family enzyme